MRNPLTIVALLTLSWAAIANVANSQAGERYALLVGVRSYSKTELTSLRYPEDDVTALRDVLVERGYPKENVVLMTQRLGAEETRFLPLADNIRKELDLLLRECGKDDHLLLSFSGHGVQFEGEQEVYFCPADARLKDRSKLISLGDIFQRLKDSPAATKVLLVDACRNDPLAGVRRGEVDLAPVGVRKPLAPPQGVAALFSCRATEAAFEHPKLQHGVFFHYVIEALKGGGDFDQDGSISLAELELYTVKRVQKYARTELGEAQTPERRGNTSGEIMLASIPRTSIPTKPPMPAPSASTPMPPKPSPQAQADVPVLHSYLHIPESCRGISLSADGRKLLSAGAGFLVKNGQSVPNPHNLVMWNAETGAEMVRFQGHERHIWSAALSQDGSIAVSGGMDGTIRVWDASTGQQRFLLEPPEELIGWKLVALSPDGTRIATSRENGGWLYLWSSSDGKLINRFRRGNFTSQLDYFKNILFSPDGKRVAAGGQMRISVFDVERVQEIQEIRGFGRSYGLAFSKDSRLLVSGGDDKIVRLWQFPAADASQVKNLAKFEGHTGRVLCVAFSPDGTRALTGGDNTLVETKDNAAARLWDVQTGKEIARLEGHTFGVGAVAFSPSGDRAFTGGGDGIRFWKLPD